MILIITRHDVRAEFHHLPEEEIQLHHTHAHERRAKEMVSIIMAHCDAFLFLNQDGSVRVLDGILSGIQYANVQAALDAIPCLYVLRF